MSARADSRSITSTIAGFWSKASYGELPAEAVHAAKRHLLDTLAAGIAGAGSEVAAAARAGVSAAHESAGGSSVLWGDSATLPPPQAALVNGTASHALELDDFGGCGHSGAVVIPAVCAVADQLGVDGKAMLLAIVAGYDLAARTLEGAGGYRAHNDLGWHSTGTCGSFGAAAAVAKLFGLDAERFTSALGIAGTFTGGIWAYLVDGAMTKRFHPGKAAENGVNAAYLARAGMTGPRFVLEAEWGGFFGTYAHGIARPEETLVGIGREFRIMRSGIKPYACCRGIHGCFDALFELMAEGLFRHDAIERIVVHGSAQTKRQFGNTHVETLLDAQFSLPYSLAVAAESGRGTIDQFWPLRAGESVIAGLMARTEIVADRTLKPGENPTLEIVLRDGRRFERQTGFAKGAPENPVPDDELEAKAETLIAPVLGKGAFRAILAQIRALETLADSRRLTELLRPASRATRRA